MQRHGVKSDIFPLLAFTKLYMLLLGFDLATRPGVFTAFDLNKIYMSKTFGDFMWPQGSLEGSRWCCFPHSTLPSQAARHLR